MNTKMKTKFFSLKGLLVCFFVTAIAFVLLSLLSTALLKTLTQFERFYSIAVYAVFVVLSFVVAFVNRLGGGGVLQSLLVSAVFSLVLIAIGLIAGDHVEFLELVIRYLLFVLFSVLFSYFIQTKKRGKYKKNQFPFKK